MHPASSAELLHSPLIILCSMKTKWWILSSRLINATWESNILAPLKYLWPFSKIHELQTPTDFSVQCRAQRANFAKCSFLRSHVHSAFHSQSTTTLAMTSYKFMAINQWWALKLLTGHHSGRHTTFARSFISIVDSIPLPYNTIYKGIYPRTILFFVSPSMHFLAIANTTQKNHNKTEHSG